MVPTIMFSFNMMEAARRCRVKRFMFTSSIGVYAPSKIFNEDDVWKTFPSNNDRFAGWAKRICELQAESYKIQYNLKNFSIVRPANVYGPGDNFDLNTSHVIPALIRKFHEAKITNLPEVEVWGTGNPKREFLHVDDLADACIYLFENLEADNLYSYGVTHINIGSGSDLSIRDLANTIADVVDYKGVVIFNTSMPDGTPRKLLDVARLEKFGWKSKIDFHKGLLDTYLWYLSKVK